MTVERRERPTIMSGKVITFATGFEERPGAFGPCHDATGPFEVSASRDAVMVHRAECRTANQVFDLVDAISQAQSFAQSMARQDRGNFQSDGGEKR